LLACFPVVGSSTHYFYGCKVLCTNFQVLVAPQQQQLDCSLSLSLSLLLVIYYYHVLSHPLALATSQVHCWILVLGVCCGEEK
jgi:hypothetical protein